ncbi:hypothetical protein NKJ73_21105 [Mesorhizobium sp. M0074]|uniref:hypothetical protein n=1 Tax=unclassified Mesorhizobium TaxID=325217 RepID=UPI003337B17D
MQSRHLRHGRHTAQLSTMIGSAFAHIAMGRTVTNPLGGSLDMVPMYTGKPWSYSSWARIAG